MPGIAHVINYDLPQDGASGRAMTHRLIGQSEFRPESNAEIVRRHLRPSHRADSGLESIPPHE